jgi:hypothetical protein
MVVSPESARGREAVTPAELRQLSLVRPVAERVVVPVEAWARVWPAAAPLPEVQAPVSALGRVSVQLS